MYPVKEDTAITIPVFGHDASGDAVLSMVDGGFTKRISKNGGAFGAMTVTITEMENGWYSIPLSASHTDTAGVLSLTFTNASCKQINIQLRVHARLPDDLAWPTTTGRSMDVETDGHVHADLKEWLGVAPSALVAGLVQADAVAISADTAAADALETMLDGTGGNALTATFTGNLTGSVGSVTGAVGSVTGNVGGNVVGTVASVVGAVGSVTGNVGGNVAGTIGGLTAAALADFFDTDSGTTYGAAIAGSVVKEIADNAAGATPANIADAVWDEARAGHVAGGSFGEGVASVQGNLTGSVGSVTGAVGSVTGNVGGNVVGTVASVVGAVGSVTGNVGGNVTGTIGGLTAAALADFFDTDSGTTYAASVAGSVVKEIADNAGGVSPASIADAVWDEARAGHVAAGSFGQGVASVQGNVTGSVGSVTGAVGSVTGSVGSVTGNVGGNVVGTVASVVGAVGSVTGNVGGNLTGTIGGLTAAALADFFDTDSGTTYGAAVAGSVVKEIADNAAGATPANIADAVWDEARAGHVAAGSFGQGVASVQGNVTGSVGSVVGTVGSVTGNVGGNVIGSVASVIATVTADMVSIDGQLTTGNNATLNLKQLNIQNSAGTAFLAQSTGGNGHGFQSVGEGSGNGILALADLTGRGVDARGGVTSGEGFRALATGVNQSGFRSEGTGSGAGFVAAAGGAAGSGFVGVGGAAGQAFRADPGSGLPFSADIIDQISDGVWDEARAGHVGAGTFGEGVASVQGNVTGSVASVVGNVGGTVASVVGAVGSVTGNVGGNLVGTIGGLTAAALADFFDTDSGTTYAASVAGSVVKETADNAGGSLLTLAAIADAVWQELLAAHSGIVGSAAEALAAAATGGGPTAAQIADAVWQEAKAGHQGATIMGNIAEDLDNMQVEGRPR